MAKKIRIHKDITIRWEVTVNGEPENLDKSILTLYLTDSFNNKIVLPMSITTGSTGKLNKITATFYGKDQVSLGRYTLSLAQNTGTENSTVLDEAEAFTLVPRTFQEGGIFSQSLRTETVSLFGDLSVSGRGASAYEVWLANGNTGTEGDFLYSLIGPKGPKGDKGDTGSVGPQGPKGDTGATGPAGTDASVTASNIRTALGYTPANDGAVVHKTGDETITGYKTFTGDVDFNNGFRTAGDILFEGKVQTQTEPSSGMDLTNKAYVDSKVGSGINEYTQAEINSIINAVFE